VLQAKEPDGEFHTLLDAWKVTNIFKHFRIGISKYEYLKQLLHIDSEKKNTRYKYGITTEERLALTLKLVLKVYNYLQSAVCII
jgi:hypothetical protein